MVKEKLPILLIKELEKQSYNIGEAIRKTSNNYIFDFMIGAIVFEIQKYNSHIQEAILNVCNLGRNLLHESLKT